MRGIVVEFYKNNKVRSTLPTDGSMKFLLKHVKTSRILMLVSFVLVINAFELVGLSLFIPIIDLFQGKTSNVSGITLYVSKIVSSMGFFPVLPTFLLLLSLVFILKTAVITWMRYVSVSLAAKTQYDLRSRLFHDYLTSTAEFINNRRQGMLLSVLNDHTVRTGQAFFSLTQLLGQCATIATYTGFVIWVSWKLTLISIILGIGLGPVLGLVGRNARKEGHAYSKALENTQHRALEGLHAKKLVNAMNWASPLENRFGGDSGSLRHHWQGVAFWSNFSGIIVQPFSVVILSLVIWLSLQFQLSVAFLGAFVLAFTRLMPAIQLAVSLGTDFQANRSSMERVKALLDEAENAVEPTGHLPFFGLKSEIRLEDVRYTHGNQTPILDCLNLTLSKGQTVALIGPSGAGKTTIADLILGLYLPESGRVLVDGIALSTLDLHQFRAHIAYVPQEPVMFHDTIRVNLTLGLDRKVGMEELQEVCEKTGAWEFICQREHGLETVVGDRGVQLSGGQRQRLALARSLLRQPDILILDEATSALDNESEQWIKKTLCDLQSSKQFTILIIAHRYTTIQHADQIYEIRDRSVVPLGRWDEARAKFDR